jgi:diguanylate cyclase (GGDEF)-like protein/PAS domain S-box-containing protein
MLAALLRENEAGALAALAELEVLDSQPEPLFDHLVRAAAEVCGTPISLISLVDADRQWFKANVGLEGVAETPRRLAFCAHAVLGPDLFVVPDATADDRFADNPLVVGQPDVRFYAGAPLRLPDGQSIGTLCVIDRVARELSASQLTVLKHLGLLAVEALLQRKMARAFLASEARYRALVEDQTELVSLSDVNARLTFVNAAYANAYCSTPEAMRGSSLLAQVPESERAAVKSHLARVMASPSALEGENQVVLPGGELRWYAWTNRALFDREHRVLGVHSVGRDITESKRLAIELSRQNELLSVTLHSIADAVITTDERSQVNWMNPVAERLTGWSVQEAAGRHVDDVYRIVDEEGDVPMKSSVAACLDTGQVQEAAKRGVLIARDGQRYAIEDSAAPIRNERGEVLGTVLVTHDVTENRQLSREISHRARHDSLTGLANRAELESRLHQLLQQSQEDQSEHALLYIDLDQFKLVNDVCGHAVGDELLKRVSKLFGESVRTSDTLARLGGDEFGIILAHCSVEHALRVAQKICDRMDQFRFVHGERRFRVGASIGLVPVNRRWDSAGAIQQAADATCYAAKEAGRNRVHVWFDTDQAMLARRFDLGWTSRIESALDNDGFELHAQRIAGLQGAGEGLHAELLLRLRNDDGSLSAPGAFLPAAERFHLIGRVDRWVLGKAAAWLGDTNASCGIGQLAVNLSGDSISDRAFHRWAIDLLTQVGAEVCGRLCLEITETSAVTNMVDAVAFIGQVRQMGVKVALDDFGAGASSFGYLKSLRVDYLKIDGQFIRELDSDPLNQAAVRSFIDVARVVGVKTVAEFVDSAEALARLREMGVDYAQGYFVHRPEAIGRLVRQETTSALQAPLLEEPESLRMSVRSIPAAGR